MSKAALWKKGRFVRWTKNERIQHWTLAFSFFGLAITGFALRYPDSWWSLPFRVLPGSDLRGLIHRIAAVVFVGISIHHAGYLALTLRGRRQFKEIFLRFRDWQEAKQYIGHLIDSRREPPKFGRFTYWEKLEYWALIWGSAVMIVSGFFLWFESIVLRYMPLWVIDIADVVHLYEAILASWAIVIWHYYFAIFKPSVYPFDPCMIEGSISEERLREEHPREWDLLVAEGSVPARTDEID